jgi:hypothetical protein
VKTPIYFVALERLAPTYCNVRLRSSIFARFVNERFNEPATKNAIRDIGESVLVGQRRDVSVL